MASWTAYAGGFSPFVRRLIHNMDNCAGTNKSQYCFGALALLVVFGLIDQLELWFQLQGHTKFDPDVAAQKTAGAYNANDTFNHGMLNKLFSSHVTAVGYDENLLWTWKAATPDLFQAVGNISKYRQFMILRDDGLLNLGAPLSKAASEAKDFPCDGPVFTDEVLQREAQLLAERALVGMVLPALHAKTYEGIGSGSGLFGLKTSFLVPLKPKVAYQVRLFKRPGPKDKVWIEQVGYQKTKDLTLVKAAMEKVVPCTPGELEGPRRKHVEEQMKRYIPPQHVPDKYAINSSGQTGILGKRKESQAMIFGAAPVPELATGVSSPAAAAAAGLERWDTKKHGPLLIAICDRNHNGRFPKKFALRAPIARELNVEFTALRNNAKKVEGLEFV